MKIDPIDFEQVYALGIEDDYSDKVMEQFDDFFRRYFPSRKPLHYEDINELIFEDLSARDKEKVKKLLKEASTPS